MSWLDYDENKANDGGDYTPIPIDTEIPVRISEVELRDTSTGGKMVKLTLTVIDGPHKRRKVRRNLHTVNKNEGMMHRDRRTLVDIGRICGVDLTSGPTALQRLKGCDLLCRVTGHEESEYKGKKTIFEEVGHFRSDPDARAPSFSDDDVPF
jgi:hypothetical protein